MCKHTLVYCVWGDIHSSHQIFKKFLTQIRVQNHRSRRRHFRMGTPSEQGCDSGNVPNIQSGYCPDRPISPSTSSLTWSILSNPKPQVCSKPRKFHTRGYISGYKSLPMKDSFNMCFYVRREHQWFPKLIFIIT